MGDRVEGTRSYHHFEPESTSVIKAKYLSIEDSFSVTHSFLMSPKEAQRSLISSCQYGNFWWLALTSEINHDEKDVSCKFMHPHGYTKHFYWPARDDNAYVPFSMILVKVGATKPLSSSGRQYSLSKAEIEKNNICLSRRVVLYYIIDIFQLICTICGYSKFCINFRFHICHLTPEIKVPII